MQNSTVHSSRRGSLNRTPEQVNMGEENQVFLLSPYLAPPPPPPHLWSARMSRLYLLHRKKNDLGSKKKGVLCQMRGRGIWGQRDESKERVTLFRFSSSVPRTSVTMYSMLRIVSGSGSEFCFRVRTTTQHTRGMDSQLPENGSTTPCCCCIWLRVGEMFVMWQITVKPNILVDRHAAGLLGILDSRGEF